MPDKKACNVEYTDIDNCIPIVSADEASSQAGTFTEYDEPVGEGPCFGLDLTIKETGRVQDSASINLNRNDVEDESAFGFDFVSYLLEMNPMISDGGSIVDSVDGHLIIAITISESGNIADEATSA